MRRKRRRHRSKKSGLFILVIVLFAGLFFLNKEGNLPGREPEEVRVLRQEETTQTDAGHQEYYFSLLDEKEKKTYREMLQGIRERQDEIFLTTVDEKVINKAYHAVLNDHPEVFWVHNREKVYITSYKGDEYSRFSPGYTYTEEESAEITQEMERAFNEVNSQITDGEDTYDKVKTVYSYLIDLAEYEESDDDQSIAGIFWKKKAVCAGYARAMQYLLERLNVTCIYVEGSSKDSDEGHAWNIVEIDGQYYYVDVTNGDQPKFLEGDAAQLAEHKTIIYDYLCPFPSEYEKTYTASDEFQVPACTATDKNFYVLNQACFDTYDPQEFYDFCCMRLDNGAAVIRLKYTTEEAFEAACRQYIQEGKIQDVAGYYMRLYGLSTVQYHYGIMENLKTLYFIF